MAELAERQHGVVAARQLVELGYSRPAIANAKASGRLRHLHRGVYAVGHAQDTWHSRCLAAVLACRPNAATSHTSAAWIWGLIRYRPGVIDVSAPTRRHANSKARLHYAPLANEDRAVCDGIPVTAVPRTLLDLAGLPRPSTGYNVAGYELDVYWETERFAVELDVYETHGSRQSFEDDRLRQETLKLEGVEMIRVTGRRLDRESGQVLERVALFLSQRRHQLTLNQ